MRPNSVIAGLVALATAACGLQVLEELRGVPEGWTKIGSPAQDSKVLLHLNIVQDNEAALEETIMDVSTPGHPRYGQHLSLESMKALMRPSSSATDAVMSWLESSGIETAEDDGDYINFVATISQTERLLNTKFDVYRSDINDVYVVRTLQYSIPDELHNTVYMIQPTTRFGEIRPHFSNVFDTHFRVGTDVDDSCNTTITPECLKELYNIKGPGLNTANGFLGVTGYLNEYARFADLDSFTSQFATYAEGASFKVTRVNGSQFNQTSESDSVEANLDIQYGVGVGYPVPNRFYSTDGVGPLIPDLDQPDVATRQNEPYLQFLRYILNLPDKKLPHTLTTSYGENEQSVPERYNRAVCRMFGQLGARGVSVLFSSGDTGVGSACQTNDGKNTTRFNPVFPAACPHLTSVGGTYHIEPERAISFSSGGFSDRFPRPAYQDTAVPAYLKILGEQWKGLYNPDGRGFPDVAAQAYNFSVVDKGKNILVGGTSASAPTFAAIIAKINSARIEAGKPGLGFLNPWIYGGAYKGLNDITVGGSTGCTGKSRYSGLPTPVVPYASWNATTGWDPVTGYGTPNVRKLLKLALKA